jgi:hypothetical protein
MPRLVVVIPLVLAGLLALSEPAAACSCAGEEPCRTLARADAALVGTLVERREPAHLRSSADAVTLVFRVEVSVKGELGRLVELETPAYGASCGVEADVGDRIGLFLRRGGNGWTSTLCDQIAPRELLAVGGPPQPPPAEGRPEEPSAREDAPGSTRKLAALLTVSLVAAAVLAVARPGHRR